MILETSREYFRLENELASEAMIQLFQHLSSWKLPSAEAYRNASMSNDHGFALNPLMDLKGISDDDSWRFLKNTIERTVREGRMIDFGHLPNQFLIDEAIRAREPFEAGELAHPYPSWLGVHSWEGGFNGYHVSTHPKYPGSILVIETYGLRVPPHGVRHGGKTLGDFDVILVYDIVSIKVNGPDQTILSPSLMLDEASNTEAAMRARAANSLDPMVTMLSLLSNATVPVLRKYVPDKLNKARAKAGRHPLPPHSIVKSQDYISMIASHNKVAIARGGGHHASPVPHWRRSHPRVLASGRMVQVKASKVNWRDGEELHRMFYRRKDE